MVNYVAHGQPDTVREHHEEHTSDRTYVRIAIILAIITVAEVIIYYLPSVRPILVPALIILSLAKFIAVIGYFMHLKSDSRIFRYMFVAGLVLTLAVYMALLAMFWTDSAYQPIIQPLVG